VAEKDGDSSGVDSAESTILPYEAPPTLLERNFKKESSDPIAQPVPLEADPLPPSLPVFDTSEVDDVDNVVENSKRVMLIRCPGATWMYQGDVIVPHGGVFILGRDTGRRVVSVT